MNVVMVLNQAAETWRFIVGNMVLQTIIVATVILLAVHLGRRLPSPIRHALLILALVKFVTPPVTNLPVGVFSVWNSESATESKTNHVNRPEKTRRDVVATASVDPTGSNAVTNGGPSRQLDFRNSSAVRTAPEDFAIGSRKQIGTTEGLRTESDIGSAVGGVVASDESPRPTGLESSAEILTLPLSLNAWFMLIHLTGSGVFLTCVIWRMRTVRNRITAMPKASQELQQEVKMLAQQIQFPRNVALRISADDCTPYSFGLLSPVIVISENQRMKLSESERTAVLLHELVHHRRHDLLICWCQAMLTALWWFHPAIWILNRTVRHLREDCCDDFLVTQNHVAADVYCNTLLKVARISGPSLALTVSMVECMHPLAERFRRIMDERQSRQAKVSLTGFVALLITSLVFLPGMSSASPDLDEPPNASSSKSTVPASQEKHSEGLTKTDRTREAPESVATVSWPESIQVRVFDPSGKPVEGAIVSHRVNMDSRTETREFQTNASGEVDVRLLHKQQLVDFMSIKVDAIPYVVFGKLWYFRGKQQPTIKEVYAVQLELGQSCGGQVADQKGKAIAKAEVQVNVSPVDGERKGLGPTNHVLSATTDESGEWTLDRIPNNLDHLKLKFLHADFRSDPDEVWVRAAAQEELLDKRHEKVLKKGILLTGTVTDMDGRPLPGVEMLMGSGYPAAYATVPVTDAEGKFRFPHCCVGTQPVTTWKEGWAPEVQEVAVLDAPVDIKFKLRRGKTARIRVVDGQGNPIAGAHVSPDRWRNSQSFALRRSCVDHGFAGHRTDAEGYWEWTFAPHEQVSYRVSKPGWIRLRDVLVQPETPLHQITLTPSITVNGTVVRAATKQPIADFKVTPGFGTRLYESEKVTGKDGKFKVSFKSPAAKYHVRIVATGYKTLELPVIAGADGTTTLNAELTPLEKIRYAVVRKQDGTPEPGARVIVATKNNYGSVYTNMGARSNRGTIVIADEHGRAALPELTESFSLGAISDSGFGRVTTSDFDPDSGDVVVTTIPTTRIEGTLQSDGQLLPGEPIYLSFVGPRDEQFVRFNHFGVETDSRGRFVFERVPAVGEVRVYHAIQEKDGHAIYSRPGVSARIEIPSGHTCVVELGRIGRFAVHGRFLYDDDADSSVDWRRYFASLQRLDSVAELKLKEIRHFPDQRIGLENDGSFKFQGLVEGRYRLHLSTQRGPSGSKLVDALLRSATQAEFTIDSSQDEAMLDLGTLPLRPKTGQSTRGAE